MTSFCVLCTIRILFLFNSSTTGLPFADDEKTCLFGLGWAARMGWEELQLVSLLGQQEQPMGWEEFIGG